MLTVYDADGKTETVAYAVDAQELVKTDPRWVGFRETNAKDSEKFNRDMKSIQPLKQRDNRGSLNDTIKKLENKGIRVLSTIRNEDRKVSFICSKCLFKFITTIGGEDVVCPKCYGKDKVFEKVENKVKAKKETWLEINGKHGIKTEIQEIPSFDVCERYFVKDVKLERKHDFLTVVATSETVRQDVKRWGLHGDLMAVNDAAFYLPNYQHAVSIHGQILPMIKSYKSEFRNYENNGFITHTAHYQDVGLRSENQFNADIIWRMKPIYRSSGMLAVYIGIAMGYKAILVHGMTLDERDHYYDLTPSHVKKNFTRLHSLAENGGSLDLIKKFNVRASSGKFAEEIGKTTKKWINESLQQCE